MKTLQDIVDKYPETKDVIRRYSNELASYKIQELINSELHDDINELKLDNDNMYTYLSNNPKDFTMENECKVDVFRKYMDKYSSWQLEELLENGDNLVPVKELENLQDEIEDLQDELDSKDRIISDLEDEIEELID